VSYLDRDEAERLVREAAVMNRGPWVEHSRNVARAAELIARAGPGLDPDRAYVFGCLHVTVHGLLAGQAHDEPDE